MLIIFIELTEAVSKTSALFNINKISVVRNINGTAWVYEEHEGTRPAIEILEPYSQVKALIEHEVQAERGY